MFVLKLTKKFSIQQLGAQRDKFKHKICFNASKNDLKLKSTPAIALTSRTFRDGKFLKAYKNCNKFFINIILKQISKLSYNNEFKNYFHQYQSFRDLNRVLFWKIMSINCLFNLKKLKKKKLLYYLPPSRRCIVVLMWLKNILRLNRKNDHNNNIFFFKPIATFIFSNKQVNSIQHLKLKIYKMRLSRG